MDEDEYDMVIETCSRHGQDDPQLWVTALSYFAEKEDDCKTQMEQVLRNIDQQQLLPPLLVVQTLANSRVCTLSVVKVRRIFFYLMSRFLSVMITVTVSVLVSLLSQ